MNKTVTNRDWIHVTKYVGLFKIDPSTYRQTEIAKYYFLLFVLSLK